MKKVLYVTVIYTTNLTIQYHIKGVVHTKNITIPQGHYDPASYVKEVNKEIKKNQTQIHSNQWAKSTL